MIDNLLPYLLGGIGVCLLLIILLIVKRNKGQLDPSLSLKERTFSSVLEKAVGGQYRVYCKVPMIDVIEATVDKSERAKRRALKPVSGRQFDYIVCDSTTNLIVCAVELDDHEFDQKRFKKQDLFIEELCQVIQLPLLRVAPQNGYNLVEIIERFERTIAPITSVEEPLYLKKYKLKLAPSYKPDEALAA